MADVDWRLDASALRHLVETEVGRDLQRRGQRVLNRARALCPVDEGRLRASLTMETRRSSLGPYVVVGSNLEYAVYVHEGTGIYAGRGMITPKRGRYLVWPAKNNSGIGNRRYSGGATARYVFARQVRGQPGQPFLLRALPAAID